MAEPGSRRLADDTAVPQRVFLGIGGFVAAIAVIYWFTAYEDAGTVTLAVAAILASWCGIYLWLRRRHLAATSIVGEAGDVRERQPPEPTAPGTMVESSVWPFVIGSGAAAVALGLAVSVWMLAPGGIAVVLGVVGFVRELHDS